MKLRAIAALGTALLLLLAAACGGDDDASSNRPTANTTNASESNANSSGDVSREELAKFLQESGGLSAEHADCTAGAYLDVDLSNDVLNAMLDGDFDVTDAGKIAVNLDPDDATKLAEANLKALECYGMPGIPSD